MCTGLIMSSATRNYLFLGLEVIFCLGIINLRTREEQVTSGEARWVKSRFQKDPERSLGMQKTRLAPALGHDGVRAAGTRLPSRPLLSPYKGPAAPTKICSSAHLERPSFRPDAVGANPDWPLESWGRGQAQLPLL